MHRNSFGVLTSLVAIALIGAFWCTPTFAGQSAGKTLIVALD